MAVFRVHKTRDFTVMSNHHLRDKTLTLKAKGLLSVILSLPDDWKYSIAGLAAICKEGTSAVKSALQELTEAGYVTVTKLYPNQTETGRIEYVYDIHETPQAPRKQGIENLPLEFQQVENQGQSNTDVPSTNQSNTDEPKKKERKKPEAFDAIIEQFTSDVELRQALGEFVRYRTASAQKAKKAFTSYALKQNVGKLRKLASDPKTMTAIVNQTIERGWSGFFPLKDENATVVYGRTSEFQRQAQDIDLSDFAESRKTWTEYIPEEIKR